MALIMQINETKYFGVKTDSKLHKSTANLHAS
jgi:hypothetical protein